MSQSWKTLDLKKLEVDLQKNRQKQRDLFRDLINLREEERSLEFLYYNLKFKQFKKVHDTVADLDKNLPSPEKPQMSDIDAGDTSRVEPLDLDAYVVKLARENDAETLYRVCSEYKNDLGSMAFYTAYEEAVAADAKEAIEVLSHWLKESLESASTFFFIPEQMHFPFPSCSVVTDTHIQDAVFMAAEIWAESDQASSVPGFPLRVFISALEESLENKADIDVDLAEYVLEGCPLVRRGDDDYWEVIQEWHG